MYLMFCETYFIHITNNKDLHINIKIMLANLFVPVLETGRKTRLWQTLFSCFKATA